MSVRIAGHRRCYHLSGKRLAEFFLATPREERREGRTPLRLLDLTGSKRVSYLQVRYFHSGEGARRHVLRAL